MDRSRHQQPAPKLASSNEVQLKKVLKFMFPESYLLARHFPVSSHLSKSGTGLFCTLLNLKYAQKDTNFSPSTGLSGDRDTSHTTTHDQPESHQSREYNFEVSTDPSSRSSIKNLRHNLNSSLIKHGAKVFGLCPVRRSIYDQCFDELIRQVTVNCIEQGLLLYRIRNEMKLSMDYYRKAYESAVNYSIRKAIDVELKLEESTTKSRTADRPAETVMDQSDNSERLDLEAKNKLDTFDTMKQHYESKLMEMDQLIAHQKSIIEVLSDKLVDNIEGPSQ